MFKPVEESVIEEIKKSRSGIFDEFSDRYILNFLDRIKNSFEDLEKRKECIKFNKERIYKSLAISLKNSLISIYQKSLIAEIIDKQEQLVGPTPEEKYDYFIENYLKQSVDQILERLPELRKLLETKEGYTVRAIEDFLGNLEREFDDIEKFLGEEITEISDIEIGDGDTHNDGKSVMVLKYNGENRLCYKPHALTNDLALGKMYGFLNDKNSLKYDLKHIRVLTYKDHGWQEFIKKETCKMESEIKAYMYRFGCLMSICYLFNCTDMHFENIIASKGYPYVIDTETLLTNLYGFEGKKLEMFSDMGQMVSSSVMGSMLLPINIAGIDGDKMPYDMSGLMSGAEITNVELSTITNRGRSDIGYDSVVVRIDDQLSINNALMLNEKKVDIEKYIPELTEGFTDCYRLLMNSKDELKEIVEWKELYDGEFRQVLRNTKLYYKFLDAAGHPYYLKSEKDRETVFGKLCGTGIISRAHELVVESECSQLKKGDVPYFYTKYDEHALFSGDKKVCDNFYSRTLKEVLEEKIEKLSEQDLERQLYLIKSSVYKRSSESKDVIYDVNRDIFDYINSVHLINDRSMKKEYISTALTESGEKLDQMKPTLYEGVGMAMTVLGLYLETGDEKYADAFRKMYRYDKDSIREIYKISDSLGMFNGVGACMYLYFNAAMALHDDDYMKAFRDCLDFYSEVDITDREESDVISGHAGIVHFLADISEKAGNANKKIIIKTLYRFANKLYELSIDNKLPDDTGFAHGYAGISSALIRSGSILGNTLFYEEGMKLIRKEDQYMEGSGTESGQDEESTLTAWCYGAGGILLSRIISARYAADKDRSSLEKDIREYFDKLIGYESWADYEDILCHGTLGNTDILRYYSKHVSRESVIREIEDKVNAVIAERGLKTKSKLGIQKIGLMDGLTGYLYHRIREKNEAFPCILMLESFGEVSCVNN